ncbi:protein RRP6-like 2 [Argentina anserina]|uniref:protein RRP6-like 2 n=1 Tax=Argentina anserina TaxID=57926 RepID=UPI0021765698|nr:protein RRP6-like 2 [Potentilla anserina]
MNHDSPPPRPRLLHNLATGRLASSVSNLSGSSRAIPSSEDFFYFRNFDEFKLPIEEMARQSQSMLESIAASDKTPFPSDLDDAYDWLVNANDDVLERVDASVDEFKRTRKEDEEGFQLVSGKKKKADHHPNPTQVKNKPKVPFHVPSIRKPQEQFNILVNNSNQPFDHVWLERSEDGHRFVHPLEKLSVLDFVDEDMGEDEPLKPPELEATPFKLVEEVKDLKELAAKLRAVNEFAVDLEHNQYRSFQGLTCLMQISTRTEDFLVDTLKLRIHIGPYLREVFKDPSKKKVMHGADRDIVWLQRDFGIYVCNLFDTGQASRVLKLERNSLEHLLQHYCYVSASKEYQNADWRFRPLTKEMIRYAREDTHYLLYIYDLMRTKLSSMPKESENSDAPLVEVYRRSYDICMHLYEKEVFTENSYLHIYGLQGACFNSQQLAIVSGLCEWRDVIARTEDESTGYVLPNKTLLELAKQMPDTTNKLKKVLKSKHAYIEQHLAPVVSVIRHSMQNAAFFEAAAESLEVERSKKAFEENVLVSDGSEPLVDESGRNSIDGDVSAPLQAVLPPTQESSEHGSGASDGEGKVGYEVHPKDNNLTGKIREGNSISCSLESAKVTGATVQVQKKPSRAFSALLGSAVPKKKFDAGVKDKKENKLEQIRSSVNFPFHSFSGRMEQSNPRTEEPGRGSVNPHSETAVTVSSTSSTRPSLGDFITLENGSQVPELKASALGMYGEDDPMSLSELSSSFKKCFPPHNHNRKAREPEKSQESGGLQVKPFDYEAARKQVIFGEKPAKDAGAGGEGSMKSLGSRGKKKTTVDGDDGSKELPQGRRRQAFPATGNRSATFR